jgi:hypothetical protein
LREVADHAVAGVGRRGNADPSGRGVFPNRFKRLDDSGTPGDLPLEPGSLGRGFQPLDQRTPVDGHGIANLEAGKSGHQLSCPALPHSEQLFNGLAVEVIDVKGSELEEYLFKPMKPRWLCRHQQTSYTSIC